MTAKVTRSYLTGQAGTTPDSLKKLWRTAKWLVQALLVHPFLAPHTLPTLSRCQLRSAQPLSEHTDRNVSKRYEGSGSSRLITAQGVYLLAQEGLRSSRSAKHERQGGRRRKNKSTWFSGFRLRVGFGPACFLCDSPRLRERLFFSVVICVNLCPIIL